VSADIHAFDVTYPIAITPDWPQERSGATPAPSNAFDAAKKMPVWSRTVNPYPTATAPGLSVDISNFSLFHNNRAALIKTVKIERGSLNRLNNRRTNDLMDPLPGKTVLIGDLLEARPSRTINKNLSVPLIVAARARLKRTPLPAINVRKSFNMLNVQFGSPIPLPDITNPSAKTDLDTIKNLDVKSRDVWMAFAGPELDQGRDIFDESCTVVHNVYNSTKPPKATGLIQKVMSNSLRWWKAGLMEDNFKFTTQADLISQISSLCPDEQRLIIELATLIRNELMHAGKGGEEKELLFAGNVGVKIVKCLHFPLEALGHVGPILLPSSNPNVYLGAVSNELVYRKVSEYTEQYTDDFIRSQKWEEYLHQLAVEIAELSENFEVDWGGLAGVGE
jgi:hypothetical protein